MTGKELTQALTELADEAAPPTRLDIEGAVRTGRRRRRLRSALLVAGCAAVVAAAGVTAPAVFGDPEGGGMENTAKPPERAAPVDTTHNPLATHIDFGWLPGEVASITYEAGGHAYGDTVHAKGPESDPSAYTNNPLMLWMTTYDTGGKDPGLNQGQQQTFGGEENVHRIPTTINGRKAYWLTADPQDPFNGGNAYLRWLLPNGVWAELNGYYLHFKNPEQVLKRIASAAEGGDRLVRMPLHITSIPEDFKRVLVNLTEPHGTEPAKLHANFNYAYRGGNVQIDVGEQDMAAKRPRGAPASSYACKTENELKACVTYLGADPAFLQEFGGVKGLLKRVTLLGLDESKWTERVIG